jgi:hypothetical protein
MHMMRHLPPPTRYGPGGLQRAEAMRLPRAFAPPPTRYGPSAAAGTPLQAKRIALATAAGGFRPPSQTIQRALRNDEEAEDADASSSQSVSVGGQLRSGSLNCGRYCAIAAIASQCALNKQTVEKLLPAPAQKFLGKSYGWSPGDEGQEFFDQLAKPDTPEAWRKTLASHGPVIVSGPLALGVFGHFVLIVGIIAGAKGDHSFLVLDPFSFSKTGSRKEWSFKEYQDKFDSDVYCVRKRAVERAAASLV